MTAEQVVQQLRNIRYNRPPGLRTLAKQAGVDHMTVYRAVNTGCLSPAATAALADALQRVEFSRYKNHRPAGS